MMKKYMFALLLMVLVAGSVGVSAATAEPQVQVNMNGQLVHFPDAQPYLNADQRTMVPVRFIAENLGAEVGWNSEDKIVTILLNETEIKLEIGESTALVNGEEVAFDTASILKEQRTFVPLRFVSETLDCKVLWDEGNRTAVVQTQGYIDGQLAMQTGNMEDLNDLYLAEVFYDKHIAGDKKPAYDSAKYMAERIKGAREIADRVQVYKDDKNEKFVVTLPEYDANEYIVTVKGVSDNHFPHHDPGEYQYDFMDAMEGSGYLFAVVISDYQHGAWVLYSLHGYKEGNEYVMNEGAVGRDGMRN